MEVKEDEVQVNIDAVAALVYAEKDEGGSYVREDVELPDGYTPATTDVRVEYPDEFPEKEASVYVADQLEVNGREDPNVVVSDDNPDWHLYRVPPRQDPRETVFRRFQTAMQQQNEADRADG